MDEEKTSLALVDDPIVKSLIANLDEEVASAITLSPAEVRKLVKYAVKLKYGDHNTLPMICIGPECIGNKICPLVKMGKSPLGLECLFEKYVMEQWRVDYSVSLKANMEDKVERGLINDLVEADILNSRANMVLSEEGFMMENPVGIDSATGAAIMGREEHIALKLKLQAQNRKDKLLKAFVATRESKIKAASSMQKDPSKIFAELRDKAREMQNAHTDAINAQTIEAVENK